MSKGTPSAKILVSSSTFAGVIHDTYSTHHGCKICRGDLHAHCLMSPAFNRCLPKLTLPLASCKYPVLLRFLTMTLYDIVCQDMRQQLAAATKAALGALQD